MSLACPTPPADLGAMRALLVGADCNTRHYAEAGFLALTGAQSWFPAALTASLTILVALLGYRLLLGLGGTRLAEAPLLALKVGAVLALTLQWPLFQTLVFDLAYQAPLSIARTVLGDGAAEGDPLGGAQATYDALLADSAAFTHSQSPMSPDATARVRAAASLDQAAQRLFLATAGALAAALVAVGVLTAIGPVFIVLLLFGATRGLFFGWVRAVLAVALAPMLIWGVTALMIEILRPSLVALAAQSVALTPDFGQVGSTVAVVDAFTLAQAALLVCGLIVAVGFRPSRLRADRGGRASIRSSADRTAAPVMLSRADRLAEALRQPAMVDRRFAESAAGGGGDLRLTRRIEAGRFDRAPALAPIGGTQPARRLNVTARGRR